MDNQNWVWALAAIALAAVLTLVATRDSAPVLPETPAVEEPAATESSGSNDKDTNTIIREQLGAH